MLLRGAPIQGLTPHEISARGVRRTFQNGGLFTELTALENVLVGLHGQHRQLVLRQHAGRQTRGAPRNRTATAQARELLAADGHRASGGPAGGRACPAASSAWWRSCARWRPIRRCCCWTNRPSAWLRRCAQQLGTIIRDLARNRRIGILLIEHAIELVMGISDRMVVLNYGHKVADGTPRAVRADRNVLEAYLGHA